MDEISNGADLEEFKEKIVKFLDTEYNLGLAYIIGSALFSGLPRYRNRKPKRTNAERGLIWSFTKGTKTESAIIEAEQKLANTIYSLQKIIEAVQSFDGHSKTIEPLVQSKDLLQNDLDRSRDFTSLHMGTNWIARYLAEECAVRYFEATGKKPGFGHDEINGGLSGPYARLVKKAFVAFNIDASVENATRYAAEYFSIDDKSVRRNVSDNKNRQK